jgi:hypothetical protein
VSKILMVMALAAVVSGCASAPQYAWRKEGASQHQVESDLSKCKFDIEKRGNSGDKGRDLLKLCMQGEGYRFVQVN